MRGAGLPPLGCKSPPPVSCSKTGSHCQAPVAFFLLPGGFGGLVCSWLVFNVSALLGLLPALAAFTACWGCGCGVHHAPLPSGLHAGSEAPRSRRGRAVPTCRRQGAGLCCHASRLPGAGVAHFTGLQDLPQGAATTHGARLRAVLVGRHGAALLLLVSRCRAAFPAPGAGA